MTTTDLRAWLVTTGADEDDGRPDWHPPVVFDSLAEARRWVRDVRRNLPDYRGRVERVW